MGEDVGQLEEFRAQLRAWLEENCPAEMRDATISTVTCWGGRNWRFESDAQKLWMERCIDKGYTVPTWPVEYGGAGFNRDQEKIFLDELKRIDARLPLEGMGIWMLGPALLQFGTDEQKQHYLPPIARGEIRWCQGYSEPGAGSDLASVQTKCEDMGDHWRINGQKIWTSYADHCDMIFVLVRTDSDAKKHLGITFLLIDMQAQGVEAKPIRLISGDSPFCETFFNNVSVPKTHSGGIPSHIGTVNRGWDVAKYLLTHERMMISAGAQGLGGDSRPLGAVLAEEVGGFDDPTLRAMAVKNEVDTLAIELTVERYKDLSESGQSPGDVSAMLKYVGTELNKSRYELMMSAGGSDAIEWDGIYGSRPADWLRTKANSIEGGTSEVMLGIISRRILRLPV